RRDQRRHHWSADEALCKVHIITDSELLPLRGAVSVRLQMVARGEAFCPSSSGLYSLCRCGIDHIQPFEQERNTPWCKKLRTTPHLATTTLATAESQPTAIPKQVITRSQRARFSREFSWGWSSSPVSLQASIPKRKKANSTWWATPILTLPGFGHEARLFTRCAR